MLFKKKLMKKVYVLFALALQCSLGLNAQNASNTVEGVLVSSDLNQPLEFATIVVTAAGSEEIVTGGITGEDGSFSLNISNGVYDFTYEYIGFGKMVKTGVSISSDLNLGTIRLAQSAESLDEVEIIAERTTVEIRLDKKIYNVGKDLTVRGGSVSDVLANVPSVSVDVEGNVALRGNSDVRILINGKPSGLVGLSSTEALRQLPAESIEKVEVIVAPSARYDAEGTAGILNIVLRRSKLLGMNGAVTVNGGYPSQAGLSGNVNYRTGNINLFTTSNLSRRGSQGKWDSKTTYFNEGVDEFGVPFNNPDTFQEEVRRTERVRDGGSSNLGLEWYITPKFSVTGAFTYNDRGGNNTTDNAYTGTDSNGDLTTNTRFEDEDSNDLTRQYAFNFDHQIDGTSNRLTGDFQYETSNNFELGIISQNAIDIERVKTDEFNEETLIQLDYVRPIGENAQFEAGYRGQVKSQKTVFGVDNITSGPVFTPNVGLSNSLIYDQNIQALYTQYGVKVKEKFSVLLGLRYEDTKIGINQIENDTISDINYDGWFPTVNLGYEISEKENITLAYNRRISRPRSYFINPFPSRSSPTNIFQGNVGLLPSFSNKLDAGYLNRIGNWTLNGSLYVQRTDDTVEFISEDTGEVTLVNGVEVPIIRRTPINLATNERVGFEFTVTHRADSKWNFDASFNLFNNATKGSYNGISFDRELLSWSARFNNKFTLPGAIDWQTRISYRGPTQTAITKNEGQFGVNLAFSKDLFNDKASISFNVSDLFNSQFRRQITTAPSFYSEGEFQWRRRTITGSFTYRFNQKKKRPQNGGNYEDYEGGF